MRCSWFGKPSHICSSKITIWGHVCVGSIDFCQASIHRKSMILCIVRQIELWMRCRRVMLIIHLLCLLRLLLRGKLIRKTIITRLNLRRKRELCTMSFTTSINIILRCHTSEGWVKTIPGSSNQMTKLPTELALRFNVVVTPSSTSSKWVWRIVMRNICIGRTWRLKLNRLKRCILNILTSWTDSSWVRSTFGLNI